MATITPREDNRGVRIGWQAKIRQKGYPSQSKTFRTKAQAENWAKVTESEMVRGTFIDRKDAESTTLKEALDRYSEEVIPRKKAGNRELGFIHQWAERPIARLSLARIRSKDVVAAISEMESEGKAPKTIKLHLGVLSHLFNVAGSEWGMESLTNPVQKAQGRQPKLPQGRDRRLVGDEEHRLLDACGKAQTPWLLPVVTFAIETGMRAGEMLETKGTTRADGERPIHSTGLLLKNVNIENRTAHLPQTKNGEARTVPLSSRAIEVIQGLPRSMTDRVFDTTYEAIHLSFARACKRAAIEDLRFHDLRHEATSRFFEKGLNPVQVAAITGHKTLQMLKRYTHLKAEDLAILLG
ncbi:site-specific integrase [Acidithiobacillus thiooxidans]|uniref:Shufflon-specific DNA recombinase n=1 Tax=Acidithiobacillus thiooxidans ATCC 19377 TaxID=637390 RepID=A0A543Q3Q8_ACITH|nr:site-specific integrase [Acidithiobacillus thiooxidans]MDX5934924.1 site-specific integrase [Acidithiobacillus thiooxidans]TQN50951.1 Shufflon-specific DNA recombinase [Acidithiobacillus thiooxidans ATCC 19377]